MKRRMMMSDKRLITGYSLHIIWSDGKTQFVDLPDDFRQAHKDIECFLDAMEEEENES